MFDGELNSVTSGLLNTLVSREQLHVVNGSRNQILSLDNKAFLEVSDLFLKLWVLVNFDEEGLRAFKLSRSPD